MSTSACWCCE